MLKLSTPEYVSKTNEFIQSKSVLIQDRSTLQISSTPQNIQNK